jgi:hypothetical protein
VGGLGNFALDSCHLTTNYYSRSFIDPNWFALDTSRGRGIETQISKLFMRVKSSCQSMRSTIVFATASDWQQWVKNAALLTLLFQRAIQLIDFGQFHYIYVMLSPFLVAHGLTGNTHTNNYRRLHTPRCHELQSQLGFDQMACISSTQHVYLTGDSAQLCSSCVMAGAPHSTGAYSKTR